MKTNISGTNWSIPKSKITEFRIKKNSYCLCVPIINEGERFTKQITRLRNFSNILDILILDGGSTDGSINLQFLKKNKVRTLLIKTGPGRLGAQLRMGYAYALRQGYLGIITIDGNGKDNEQAIPDFIRALNMGFDYVQGSRFISGGQGVNTPLVRHLAVRLIHAPLISLAAKYHFTDTTPGFRAYSSKFLLDSKVQPFRSIFVSYELLTYLTVRAPQLNFKVKEVPIVRSYPLCGKTPTKISFIQGNFLLLNILIKTIFGQFNP